MVKWTPELDAVLLLKVIEVCDVKMTMAQYQEIANKWPAHLERPTDRAISEHLFMMRKKAKAATNEASKGGDKANGEKKPPEKRTPVKRGPRTPRKDKTKEKGTPEKAATGKGKRKRIEEEVEDDASSDDGVSLAPKPEQHLDDSDGSTFPMPTKKSRTTPTATTEDPALIYDGSCDNPIELEAI